MRSIFCIILIFILSCELDLNSQDYPFHKYSVADGLPQSQSIACTQDSRGFFWIVTHNGVSRFDGVEFRNYFRKDGLPANFIITITELPDGRIFAVAENGISFYDGRKFKCYPLDDFIIITQPVVDDTRESIILLTQKRSNGMPELLEFKDGNYIEFSRNHTEFTNIIPEDILYLKQQKELLIKERSGKIYSWKNGKLQPSARGFNNVPDNNIISTSSESSDYFYVNRGEKKFRVKYPDHNTSIQNFADSEKNVWLMGENNFYRLISLAFSSFPALEELASNIWAIQEDRNGHIWFGSLYGELQEWDGEKFIFRTEWKNLFLPGACFYKGSRKMSNGDIYFSMNCGVLVWDGEKFSRLREIPDNAQVCYIYEDPDNKSVLVGTGIGLYHIINGKVDFFHEFDDIKMGVVEGIAKEADNKYWLSTRRGLYLFDGKNVEHIQDPVLPQTFTYTLERDSIGGLWITSEEGLFYRDESGRFSQGLPEKINSPANSIMKMGSSMILVGRTTDICIIDLKKFYSGDPEYYKLYNSSHGFSGYDCLDNGIIKDNKGRYLILTSNYVDILDYKSMTINPHPPRVYITDIEAEQKVSGWTLISDPDLFYGKEDEIILSPKQNRLRFSFTGISTTNPEGVYYQHRLRGYEENWSDKSSERHVVYEKLNPGTYIFEVMAYNSDGLVNVITCPAIIKIKPALWQKLFFRILFLVFVIGLTILITSSLVKKYHRRKAAQQRMELELSHMHLGSAIKQFDPHFTFNVLSSVGSLIMSGEKEMAYDYLLKLSGLLRSVLSDGNAIIRPISEELDLVRKYCEVQKLRLGDRINWNINVYENVDLSIAIPKLTIQIFVENAIKHGFEDRMEGGMLNINIMKNMNRLEIFIKDDGIGRAAAAKHKSGTGNGIKIIKGIFEHLNRNNKEPASIEINDLYAAGKAAGTEVKISIPEKFDFGFSD
ncbi:MAG: histidine kinase [Methanosarcina sp.]